MEVEKSGKEKFINCKRRSSTMDVEEKKKLMS